MCPAAGGSHGSIAFADGAGRGVLRSGRPDGRRLSRIGQFMTRLLPHAVFLRPLHCKPAGNYEKRRPWQDTPYGQECRREKKCDKEGRQARTGRSPPGTDGTGRCGKPSCRPGDTEVPAGSGPGRQPQSRRSFQGKRWPLCLPAGRKRPRTQTYRQPVPATCRNHKTRCPGCPYR